MYSIHSETALARSDSAPGAQLKRLTHMDQNSQTHDPELRPLSALQDAQARALTLAERLELARLRALINTPELRDFSRAVVLEAAHQRELWGAEHDAGKQPQDWFWLLGYLAGKALAAQAAGDLDKALHHTISSAAVLANWHAAMSGAHTGMRPGIDPVARGIDAEGQPS